MFFFKQLAQNFNEVASHLGYQRLMLHRNFIPEAQPARLAKLIMQGTETLKALIFFANEYPAIYAQLKCYAVRGVMVISLVTDLPGVARRFHVGIN